MKHVRWNTTSNGRTFPSTLKAVEHSYRRGYWTHYAVRPQVWSEKATIGGILAPVLHAYGVGWCYVHGYSSAARIHENDEGSLNDSRHQIILECAQYLMRGGGGWPKIPAPREG